MGSIKLLFVQTINIYFVGSRIKWINIRYYQIPILAKKGLSPLRF